MKLSQTSKQAFICPKAWIWDRIEEPRQFESFIVLQCLNIDYSIYLHLSNARKRLKTHNTYSPWLGRKRWSNSGAEGVGDWPRALFEVGSQESLQAHPQPLLFPGTPWVLGLTVKSALKGKKSKMAAKKLITWAMQNVGKIWTCFFFISIFMNCNFFGSNIITMRSRGKYYLNLDKPSLANLNTYYCLSNFIVQLHSWYSSDVCS